MRFRSKNGRRQKRARAVRRLQGVVNAQDTTIRSLRGQVEGLGGKVDTLDKDLKVECDNRDGFLHSLTQATQKFQARIRRLERVPRVLRWLFGAL